MNQIHVQKFLNTTEFPFADENTETHTDAVTFPTLHR